MHVWSLPRAAFCLEPSKARSHLRSWSYRRFKGDGAGGWKRPNSLSKLLLPLEGNRKDPSEWLPQGEWPPARGPAPSPGRARGAHGRAREGERPGRAAAPRPGTRPRPGSPSHTFLLGRSTTCHTKRISSLSSEPSLAPYAPAVAPNNTTKESLCEAVMTTGGNNYNQKQRSKKKREKKRTHTQKNKTNPTKAHPLPPSDQRGKERTRSHNIKNRERAI